MQGGHAIVQTDFLRDLAVFDPKHRRSRELHLPARRRWQRPHEEIAEGRAGVRAAAFPASNHIVALGNEVRRAREREVRERLRNPVMNALMSSWPRRGACSEYCRSMSGAAARRHPEIAGLPQNPVNQRPTIALLSLSFDMTLFLPFCVWFTCSDISVPSAIRAMNSGHVHGLHVAVRMGPAKRVERGSGLSSALTSPARESSVGPRFPPHPGCSIP